MCLSAYCLRRLVFMFSGMGLVSCTRSIKFHGTMGFGSGCSTASEFTRPEESSGDRPILCMFETEVVLLSYFFGVFSPVGEVDAAADSLNVQEVTEAADRSSCTIV